MCSIYVKFNYGLKVGKSYKPFQMTLPAVRIEPRHWDDKKQRPKAGTPEKSKKAITNMLRRFEDGIYNVYQDFVADMNIYPDTDIFRSKLEITLGISQDVKKLNILTYGSMLIDRRKNAGLSHHTTKGDENKHKKLREFIVESGLSPAFRDMDYRFCEKYEYWLYENEYEPVTVKDGFFKWLRMVFSEAKRDKVMDTNWFAENNYKITVRRKRMQYLTVDEIQRLIDLKLKGTKADIRDCFVFACYMSLRVGDIQKLAKQGAKPFIQTKPDGLEYLCKIAGKTGKSVDMPLLPICKEILERHNYKLPFRISEQKGNDAIKDICRLAKITQQVVVVSYQGNTPKETFLPKCELISWHTARRSYATNAVKHGTPISFVQKVLGHSDESTTRDYIQLTQDDFSAIAKQSDFYKDWTNGGE